jgi:hypothetical protein
MIDFCAYLDGRSFGLDEVAELGAIAQQCRISAAFDR